jgi:STE24 endopeptidase
MERNAPFETDEEGYAMSRPTLPFAAWLLAGILITSVAAAQAPTAGPTSAAPAAAAADSPTTPAAAPSSLDPEAATRAYLATMSAQDRARSDAYFEGGYWIILWDTLISLLVCWIFLKTGLLANTRDWAERMTRFRWLQTLICAAVYILVQTILLLPWSLFTGYFREHQYNMSNQTMGAFLSDEAKGLLIALILGSLAITCLYAVVRKLPRTWWIWGAVLAIVFAMLTVAVAPALLEPVFNKFKPLPASSLKEQVLSMARASGIPATDVYEFDASKQTKRMSAHVSGFGGTTQISMNDNLMNRGSNEEILSVLGHEMGHYVLHHVEKGLTQISIVIVIGFALVRWAFGKMIAKKGVEWRIRDIGDVAGLPLFAAILTIFSFFLTPVLNSTTRTMEAEADCFGINASRQPDGFAQAALHLSEYRKMEPGPIEEFVFYDHPSGWNRIHRVMVWKKEHLHDADIVAYDAAHPQRPEANVR